MEENW